MRYLSQRHFALDSLCARTGRSLAVPILVVALFATACGDQNKQSAEQDAEQAKEETADEEGPATVHEGRKRRDELDREGKQIETFDLNQDGRPDQWEIRSEEGGLLWLARDMNFDARLDVWQYPNEAGEILEEEMDLDMDGTIDLVNYYEDGEVRRKEMSVDFEEEFSIVKFYNKKGQLLRVERDEDRDGTTDVWEYYDDQGNRERVGWDDDGDGVPDTFDQMP